MRRRSIYELEINLKLQEYALAVLSQRDYPDQQTFRAAQNWRAQTIRKLRGQLWDMTHKSKYVLRPMPEVL